MYNQDISMLCATTKREDILTDMLRTITESSNQYVDIHSTRPEAFSLKFPKNFAGYSQHNTN